MLTIFHNFLSKIRDSVAASVYNKLYFSERVHHLTYQALNSKEKGVAGIAGDNVEIVVSLTTHVNRIYDSFLAIESIMQGSVKPNRIILWLAKDIQNESLPKVLLNQIERGLEVNYTEDIGPYTKFIPALKENPDSIIVTIDDDILYPFDTLEMLLTAHKKYPLCICANRIMDITLDNQGMPTSLPSWKELDDKERISKLNFFEGVGGVLYPPHCFTSDVLNQQVFVDICPTADDVWLNCMALLSNTPIIPSNLHYPHFPLLINESIQDSALWRINNKDKVTLNDKQLYAVMKHFNLSYVD